MLIKKQPSLPRSYAENETTISVPSQIALPKLDWNLVPIPILLKILAKLNADGIVSASRICRRWRSCAFDQSVWKNRFFQDYSFSWKESSSIESWFEEYAKIYLESPVHLAQVFGKSNAHFDNLSRSELEQQRGNGHRDEVLHVAFAPDGTVFVSCSKDAYVKLWWCGDNPCDAEAVTFLCEKDMGTFLKWEYTQFSQFNQDSTLLLVSGVILSSDHISGEIAIFDVDVSTPQLHFRSRVLNRPYDVFGCWYDSSHILSGEMMPLSGMLSVSHIWLCKASQDTHNERTAVLAPLTKFLNQNASNVRMLKVCDKVSPKLKANLLLRQHLIQLEKSKVPGTDCLKIEKEIEDCLVYLDTPEQFLTDRDLVDDFADGNLNATISKCDNCTKNHGAKLQISCSCVCHSEVKDRLLIFAHGCKVYTPHEVGFKLIRGKDVLSRLNAEVMPDSRREAIHEQIRIRRERADLEPLEVAMEVIDGREDVQLVDQDQGRQLRAANEIVADLERQFDSADYTIDVNGHILSMNLSSDHRLLYVNVRPWVEGEVLDGFDPMLPPTIKNTIEMRVIDIDEMKMLETPVFCGHMGFTPNERCFVIYSDAAGEFVGSGSEDRRGVIWSSGHGCMVGQLDHDDVVNCVALNPVDPQMAVSASDDHTIKVWRSRNEIIKSGSELGVKL